MMKTIIVVLAGIILLTASVKAQTGAPVETKQANSPDYKPAFKGQTRVGSVVTKTAYEGKVITSSLQSPWGIAPLPDGRFLITEKPGTMRIVTASGGVGQPISGVPPVVYDGQGGLLGVTIDPAFTKNWMIY